MPLCPCCERSDAVTLLATVDFPVNDGKGGRKILPSKLYDCRRCDLVVRNLDYEQREVASHYEVTSYTAPEREELYHTRRIRWFRWFTGRTIARSGIREGRLVDFGCSYGHLLDCFAERGWEVKGVEVSAQALACLAEKRPEYEIVSSLEQIDPGWADVVVALDSLYCVQRPRVTMRHVYEVLRPGGLFAGRVTRRNFHYRVARWVRGRHLPPGEAPKFGWRLAGDAKTGFSRKSLDRMLSEVGFRGTRYMTLEPGKRTGLVSFVQQKGMWVIEQISLGLLPLAPGLQFWTKKPR